MKTNFTKLLGVCCGLIAMFSFASIDANAQCAAAPGAGVDVNNLCYATVIANDPFCCDTQWDGLCDADYLACLGGGGGTCATAAETPACVDQNGAAYASVIAGDPFCCDTSWDGLCQSDYDALSSTCVVAPCAAAPGAGVDVNNPCYASVIAADSFCCDTEWDGLCDADYLACLGGGGDCATVAETPACVDQSSAAYASVIAGDPFCCDTSWDGLCQSNYDALSSTCVAAPCAAAPGVGVDVNNPCYATVIAADSFCCDNTWDTVCDAAYADCIGGGGDCAAAAETPACVDQNSAAYASVISGDPFCCDTSWDGVCQASYDALSSSCVVAPCAAAPGVGVDVNNPCYASVIAADSFCCDNTWDTVCDAAYADCIGGGGDCATVAETPACVDQNSAAYATVIAGDAFCCDNSWDGLCQSAYDALSSTCIVAPCASAAEIPACVDQDGAAFAQVIADDPFCCDTSWDGLCQADYDALSASCGPCPALETTPACVDQNSAAYATVIADDPFCCDTSWDGLCQASYDALSSTCIVAPCASAAEIPACVDQDGAAFAQVIADDPFCCDTGWDGVCQAAYDALSSSCGPCPALDTTPECVDTESAAYAQVIADDPFCCDTSWDGLCQASYDALSTTCTGCTANGGTLVAASDNRSFCVGTGSFSSLSVSAVGASGSLQVWALVNSAGDIVDTRNNNSNFNLDTYPAGNYSIRFAAFELPTNIGTITNIDQIGTVTGCFATSSNIISIFLREEPTAGTLSAASPTTVCANSGPSTGIQVSLSGFSGENVRYGLSSNALGNQVVATLAGTTSGATFNLNGLPAGGYRVTALAFQQGVQLVGVDFASQLQGCFDLSNFVNVNIVDCAAATLESSPNPTASQSFVTFTNPREEYATLEVYDMSGRMVERLFNQVTNPGQEYRLEFNGSSLPNGVYLYRLTTDSEVVVNKFMIAR